MHLESHCQKEQDPIRNPVYGSEDPDPYQHVTDPEHQKGPLNKFGHRCPYEARKYLIFIGFLSQKIGTLYETIISNLDRLVQKVSELIESKFVKLR
jgi:hypothetical protein